MADVFTKEKRSEIMSKIKGKNTKIELIVSSFLHKNNIRFRKNNAKILGRPDISIKKYKIAIFINGCFWHGHDICKAYRTPKSNTGYWFEKIESNKRRDKNINEQLAKDGWNIFTAWECDIKRNKLETLNEILKFVLRIKDTHNNRNQTIQG